MKKRLLLIAIIFFLAIPVFAGIKYPSEQMVRRCFPIGSTYWNAKLNMAQISLDYQLEMIYYEQHEIRFVMSLDEDNAIDVALYFHNEETVGAKPHVEKLWFIDYLKMRKYSGGRYKIETQEEW